MSNLFFFKILTVKSNYKVLKKEVKRSVIATYGITFVCINNTDFGLPTTYINKNAKNDNLNNQSDNK